MSTTHFLFPSMHMSTIPLINMNVSICNITTMIGRNVWYLEKMNSAITFRSVLIQNLWYNYL